MTYERIRDLGYNPGQSWLSPGPLNSITDVPGLQISVHTLLSGNLHKGVTVISPRPGNDIWTKPVFASIWAINGLGELTSSHVINEVGLLQTPIALTDTIHVGAVYDAVLKHAYKFVPKEEREDFCLPCVGETLDQLSPVDSLGTLKPEHVSQAFANLAPSRSPPEFEGSQGGGTGMRCLGFKGGNGSSSRLIPNGSGSFFTLGCFVQSNFGAARDFTIRGIPIGVQLCREGFHGPQKQQAEEEMDSHMKLEGEGSVIIILATDAPMVPHQLSRLLRRIPIGLARVGGASHHLSGDIGLAISTVEPTEGASKKGTFGPTGVGKVSTKTMEIVDESGMNALFYATADVVEEAVLNALCAGKDEVGWDGQKVKGLPHDKIKDILKKYLD